MTDLEKRIFEKYTADQFLNGDDGDVRTVWLKVGGQSFCLSRYEISAEEAKWMRQQLAEAIAILIDQELKQVIEERLKQNDHRP